MSSPAVQNETPKCVESSECDFHCQVDETLYPEAYRKGDYVKGSNDCVPEPFRVAQILKITTSASIKGTPSLEDVKLTVQKFYR